MPTPAALPWTLVRDALPPVAPAAHRAAWERSDALLLAITNADAPDGVQYSTGYYDDDEGQTYFVVDGDDHYGSDAAHVIAWLFLTPPSL